MAADRRPDRAALVQAFEQARAADDAAGMASSALALAADRTFGAPLGGVAAYLHEAYRRASGTQRVRLAVELARTWVYGGEPERAVPFAHEAVAAAEELGDPALLAAALDAELGVHWGPDDVAARSAITSRLEDVVAHVTDVEARLAAHLWRLTTALEGLDLIGVQRQLCALDDLAAATGSARVRMFAASRRCVHALITGDLAAATDLVEVACRAGREAGEPDTVALEHELGAGIARQGADRAALARLAAAFEEFGTAHGVRSVLAEAALLWTDAGHADRARALVDLLAGPGLAAIPRDVDWLLTVALLTQVAAGAGGGDVLAEAVDLLTPYAGRGVVNAGAVSFLGVVDDHLARACAALGRGDEAAEWAGRARTRYARMGATWWLTRLDSAGFVARPSAGIAAGPSTGDSVVAARPDPPSARLIPGPDGVWTVGFAERAVAVRELRGFRYLRLLLERPGVEVTALHLAAAVAGQRAPLAESGFGDRADRQALAAYRRRLATLDDDLARAREWGDTVRGAAVAAERGMLLDEIGAATGLSGRPRTGGASAERARVAVRKAIAVAVQRLADADGDLGDLLRHTVRTGLTCCYEPDPARPVRWLLHD